MIPNKIKETAKRGRERCGGSKSTANENKGSLESRSFAELVPRLSCRGVRILLISILLIASTTLVLPLGFQFSNTATADSSSLVWSNTAGDDPHYFTFYDESEGNIYLLNQSAKIYQFDSSGAVVETINLNTPPSFSAVAKYDQQENVLYYIGSGSGGGSERFIAYDLDTKTQIYNVPSPRPGIALAGIDIADNVVVVSQLGVINAYDKSDGSIVWQETDGFGFAIKYSESTGDLYYTKGDGTIVRVDPSDGSVINSASIGISNNYGYTTVDTSGGDYFIGYEDNTEIYKVNTADISDVETFSVSGDIGGLVYSPAVERLYVGVNSEVDVRHTDFSLDHVISGPSAADSIAVSTTGSTPRIYVAWFNDGIFAYDSTTPLPFSVTGTVTDEDEEPISNVTVEISNTTSDELVVTTATDEDGEFTTMLPNGGYVANFSKSGFSDAQETFTVAGGPVSIDVQLVEERLRLDTRQLFKPGSTHEYRVIFETGDESGNVVGTDVTDSAIVTSLNSSILTVNEGQQTMTAVDDKNVSKVVTINMSYQTYSAQAEIVVAEATVDNLAILPTGLSRGQAVMLDDFIFALLIAAFLSVPACRFANAFAGLGVAEMVIVVGWLGGFVPLGIAMLSIFMAMFVGLNLAANIDYAMRR